MLPIETLAIADSYEWLLVGSYAEHYLSCSQSTISRTVTKVSLFRKSLDQLGAHHLFDKEREIHQRMRFAQGARLRLHAYQWTNHFIRHGLSEPWHVNPLGVSATKLPGLQLLEQRIIDAICAPYPLVANADKAIFSMIPLYTSQLQLLIDRGNVLCHERDLSAGDIASTTRLSRLAYVPAEASRCSQQIDSALIGCQLQSAEGLDSAVRYWGTPLTPIVSRSLTPIAFDVVYPYAEFLVVLRDWVNHPLIEGLHKEITGLLSKGIAEGPEGDCISISF